MIDTDEIIRTFEKNFKKMSYVEREQYLKDMGFSYGTKKRSKRAPVAAQLGDSRNVKTCSIKPTGSYRAKKRSKRAPVAAQLGDSRNVKACSIKPFEFSNVAMKCGRRAQLAQRNACSNVRTFDSFARTSSETFVSASQREKK